jgi:hypothetical protein
MRLYPENFHGLYNSAPVPIGESPIHYRDIYLHQILFSPIYNDLGFINNSKRPCCGDRRASKAKGKQPVSWQAFRLNDATYIGSCGKDRSVYHLLSHIIKDTDERSGSMRKCVWTSATSGKAPSRLIIHGV